MARRRSRDDSPVASDIALKRSQNGTLDYADGPASHASYVANGKLDGQAFFAYAHEFPSSCSTGSSGNYPTCSFCESKGKPCIYDAVPPPRNTSFLENGHSPTSHFETLATPPDRMTVLPPLNVFYLALTAFYEHFVDVGLYNFIHRDTFADAVSKGAASKELMLAICALSARFCPALAELHESPTAAAKFYAGKALDIVRATPDTSTLSRLQCLLMLALHDCTEGRESRGWILLGVAVRLCNILQLARFEPPDDGIVGPSTTLGASSTAIQSEVRRRTYWSAFLLDRLLCDGYERPSMMRIDPFFATIRMPRTDADFELGRWALAARFEGDVPAWARSETSARRPQQEPEADLFGQLLRIADLWSKVVSYVGAGGHNIDRRAPWDPESTFARLDMHLTHWRESLASDMKFNEANRVAHAMVGRGQLFVLVHLAYYASLLYLHRDYIPFVPPGGSYDPGSGVTEGETLIMSSPPPSGFWLRSTHKVFDSADTITDLVRSVNGGFAGGGLMGQPFAGFAVLTASTMHAHLHWFAMNRQPRYQQYVVADAQILDRYRQYWPVAKQWCRNLGLLYDTYGNHRDMAIFAAPQPASGTSSLPWARTRDDIMRIVPTSEDDQPEQTSGHPSHHTGMHPANGSGSRSRESSARPARKRYDLFALLKEPAMLGPVELAVGADSPIVDHSVTDPLTDLLGPNTPGDHFDPLSLNSFTDWALSGLGSGQAGSWWLNLSP